MLFLDAVCSLAPRWADWAWGQKEENDDCSKCEVSPGLGACPTGRASQFSYGMSPADFISTKGELHVGPGSTSGLRDRAPRELYLRPFCVTSFSVRLSKLLNFSLTFLSCRFESSCPSLWRVRVCFLCLQLTQFCSQKGSLIRLSFEVRELGVTNRSAAVQSCSCPVVVTDNFWEKSRCVWINFWSRQLGKTNWRADFLKPEPKFCTYWGPGPLLCLKDIHSIVLLKCWHESLLVALKYPVLIFPRANCCPPGLSSSWCVLNLNYSVLKNLFSFYLFSDYLGKLKLRRVFNFYCFLGFCFGDWPFVIEISVIETECIIPCCRTCPLGIAYFWPEAIIN